MTAEAGPGELITEPPALWPPGRKSGPHDAAQHRPVRYSPTSARPDYTWPAHVPAAELRRMIAREVRLAEAMAKEEFPEWDFEAVRAGTVARGTAFIVGTYSSGTKAT